MRLESILNKITKGSKTNQGIDATSIRVDASEKNRSFLKFQAEIDPSSLLVAIVEGKREICAIEKIPWYWTDPVVIYSAQSENEVEKKQGIRFKGTIDVESLRYDQELKMFVGLKDSGVMHASKQIINIEGVLKGKLPRAINSYSFLKTTSYVGMVYGSTKRIVIQGDDITRGGAFKKGIYPNSLRVLPSIIPTEYELVGVRSNNSKLVINKGGFKKVILPKDIYPGSLTIMSGNQSGLVTQVYCAGALDSKRIIFTDPSDNKKFQYVDATEKFSPESLRYDIESQTFIVVHKDHKTVELIPRRE
ncbi:MAG: hypothetical protein ACP5N2_02815 [Candidatus Nanoarchaeia archaeon]